MHAPPATTHLSRPSLGEYDPYYARYVSRVADGAVLDRLAAQMDEMNATFGALDEGTALRRYAPGKWSVKEVLGHMTDTERIFTHRALRFARADATPLPGFDENAYVPAAGFDRRELGSLLNEWRTVRAATNVLFRSLEPEAWDRGGLASGAPVSVRALSYITAGHTDHHLAILHERYGIDTAESVSPLS